MAVTVLAVYTPKPGKGDELRKLLHIHVARLREWGLATDTSSVLLRASDGSYLELFDWVSAEAIKQAHGHPGVQAMWEAFGAVCDYGTLGSLAEAGDMFAEFKRVEG